MNLEQINYVMEIVKYQSFTAAAKYLHVNQSTVSRQIADLEEELGAELFVRTGRSIELTEAGRIFVHDGKDILKRVGILKDKISRMGKGKGGKLTVGVPVNLFGWNQEVLGVDALKEYPDARIRFLMMPMEEINTALICGDIDIGFTFEFAIRELLEELKYKVIDRRPFVFFAGKRNGATIPDVLTQQELYSYPLTLLKTDYQPQFLVRIISRVTFEEMNPPEFCHNYESILLEVSMGKSIGVLPEVVYESARDSYGLRRIEVEGIENQINYVMAYNRKNPNPMIPSFYSRTQRDRQV